MRHDTHIVRAIHNRTLFCCNRMLRVLAVPDIYYDNTVDIDNEEFDDAVNEFRDVFSEIRRLR